MYTHTHTEKDRETTDRHIERKRERGVGEGRAEKGVFVVLTVKVGRAGVGRLRKRCVTLQRPIPVAFLYQLQTPRGTSSRVMGAGCCCFIDRQFTELLFLEGPSFVAERRRREILGLPRSGQSVGDASESLSLYPPLPLFSSLSLARSLVPLSLGFLHLLDSRIF